MGNIHNASVTPIENNSNSEICVNDGSQGGLSVHTEKSNNQGTFVNAQSEVTVNSEKLSVETNSDERNSGERKSGERKSGDKDMSTMIREDGVEDSTGQQSRTEITDESTANAGPVAKLNRSAQGENNSVHN